MENKTYISIAKMFVFVFILSLSVNNLSGKKSIGKLLFDSDEILDIHIITDISKIRKDRGKNQAYHPAKLVVFEAGKQQITIDVLVRTRGIFRLNPRVCNFPPLRLKFKKQDVKKTIFKGIGKLKMVTHCQDRKKLYQKYVFREYLVYKLYNLLTEESFRARLVRVTYIDTGRKNKKLEKFGFFIEPVEMVAARNQYRYLKIEPTTRYTLNSDQSSFLSVFQFMIGNTDWSYMVDHNVKRLIPKTGGPTIGVPYDFDFAGIVNTLYAVPAKVAKTTSTKDRYFQGFCQPMEFFEKIFDRFRKKKNDIYSLYENFPYIDKGYKRATKKFLNKFFKIINTPRLAKRYIYKSCVQKTLKK